MLCCTCSYVDISWLNFAKCVSSQATVGLCMNFLVVVFSSKRRQNQISVGQNLQKIVTISLQNSFLRFLETYVCFIASGDKKTKCEIPNFFVLIFVVLKIRKNLQQQLITHSWDLNHQNIWGFSFLWNFSYDISLKRLYVFTWVTVLYWTYR